MSLNDQATTTGQLLDITANAIGTVFQRSGAARINVFFSPLTSFQWRGGSGDDTVNVRANPATTSSTFVLGDGDDGRLEAVGEVRGDGADHGAVALLVLRDDGILDALEAGQGIGGGHGDGGHGDLQG